MDGNPVSTINANLTEMTNLAEAKPLSENRRTGFQGSQKIGPFDVSLRQALDWLLAPNPHGKPNSDVLKPSCNGMDLARRSRDCWMIVFGIEMEVEEAALYQEPFKYALINLKGASGFVWGKIIGWNEHRCAKPF